MASSSSTLLAPLPRNCKHHVFPSFHGEDVRTNFLSHIVKDFRSKGIDLFIDNDIERSKSIGPALIEAIRGSRIAVVLLSTNYASSTWCLNELVEIMNCREEFGQTVIPIFYRVNPTDIKKQKGYFGKVFRKTCQGKIKEEIQRWKHAMTEVAKIEGYHLKNWKNEAEMIEDIAADVSNKLNFSAPCSDFDSLVGMESHMTRMEPLLRLDSDEVRKIGILGPPGIGKTTIARSLFNRHSHDFQLSVFMDNIKTKWVIPAYSDDYSVKLDLQKQFFSQLTNEKDIKIPHLGIVKDRLKDKKVLVVLDDVDRSMQVEAMAKETCWFGPGSRIIATTQDQNVLKASGINHIHKVNLPSYEDAFRMFCVYAFREEQCRDGFSALVWEVINLVGRLPLGLRVMGSYFRGMSEQDWTYALPRLRTHLERDGETAGILKFSYDSLCDEDKSLFLHIACFFNHEKVDIVEGCLAKCFLDVTQGLRILVEKSLISIDDLGRVDMSTLLVQLGRKIVREKSVSEPGKRQFLIKPAEIDEVLSDDKSGSSSVIGIIHLDWDKDMTWTSERAFKRLSNLQFLRIESSGVNPKSMNYISRKLRVLIWSRFHMSCFPSSFNPKFLVRLEMQSSTLEKLWDENNPLINLKWMDLSYSGLLKMLPDLSTATNLQELNLKYCSSLVELPFSIGNATNLQKLNLSHCLNLVRLPFSIGNAVNLEEMNLNHCSSLVKLPSSIGNAINLQKLNLRKCSSLVRLPSTIGNAINLQELNLSYCSSLVKLPSSIRNATNLQKLNIKCCSSLVKLPSSIGNMVNLEELDLRYCLSLVELPFSIGNAVNLEYMYLRGCSSLWELPSSMRNLSGLCGLGLEECSRLEVNLANINLESLKDLSISGCSSLKVYLESSTEIQELDPWIGSISNLRQLYLRRMKKLVSLPQLPDSVVELDAENCKSLKRLDCTFRNPDICLNFANCFKLNQEAKNLIIHTPTNGYAIFPGVEIPNCFTYRSSGSSLTVKLNRLPVGKSTKFKACILSAGGKEDDLSLLESASLCCTITSGENVSIACNKEVEPVLSENLCTFEVEVETEDVTSTDLLFDFQLFISKSNTWKIKECGILQLPLLSSTHGDEPSVIENFADGDESSDIESLGDGDDDSESSSYVNSSGTSDESSDYESEGDNDEDYV